MVDAVRSILGNRHIDDIQVNPDCVGAGKCGAIFEVIYPKGYLVKKLFHQAGHPDETIRNFSLFFERLAFYLNPLTQDSFIKDLDAPILHPYLLNAEGRGLFISEEVAWGEADQSLKQTQSFDETRLDEREAIKDRIFALLRLSKDKLDENLINFSDNVLGSCNPSYGLNFS